MIDGKEWMSSARRQDFAVLDFGRSKSSSGRERLRFISVSSTRILKVSPFDRSEKVKRMSRDKDDRGNKVIGVRRETRLNADASDNGPTTTVHGGRSDNASNDYPPRPALRRRTDGAPEKWQVHLESASAPASRCNRTGGRHLWPASWWASRRRPPRRRTRPTRNPGSPWRTGYWRSSAALSDDSGTRSPR